MLTQSDFNKWYAAHCNYFSSVRDWFGRLEEPDAVLRIWYDALKANDLSLLLEASRCLYGTREEIYPERHPAAIRNWIRNNEPKRYEQPERPDDLVSPEDWVAAFEKYGWTEAVARARWDRERDKRRRKPDPDEIRAWAARMRSKAAGGTQEEIQAG